jgi:hypothetical protein
MVGLDGRFPRKEEAMKAFVRRRRLKPEDREYLDLVRRLFLPEPADPAIVDQAVALVRDEPDVSRPTGPPDFGLTQRGHVVEIPRRPGAERNDPVRSVTGPGWLAWFPVGRTDPIVATGRRRGASHNTPPRRSCIGHRNAAGRYRGVPALCWLTRTPDFGGPFHGT